MGTYELYYISGDAARRQWRRKDLHASSLPGRHVPGRKLHFHCWHRFPGTRLLRSLKNLQFFLISTIHRSYFKNCYKCIGFIIQQKLFATAIIIFVKKKTLGLLLQMVTPVTDAYGSFTAVLLVFEVSRAFSVPAPYP